MASSNSRFYGALALVAIVGAALIAHAALRRPSASALDSAGSPPNADELVSADVGISIGSPDAPVLVEEYADYQCPGCGLVATLTLPQIFEEYVETGKARFVFFDYPLHPGPSELGAQAARCGLDQNAYWPMQKVLMARMREWGARRDPSGIFREYADALGLDGRALVACLDSGKYREVVLASQTRARQLNINQTPTFFVNGRVVAEAMSYDRLKALIEQELAKQ
jgi:protein-disulfide isomerase